MPPLGRLTPFSSRSYKALLPEQKSGGKLLVGFAWTLLLNG
jgi:hypothetical protein